MKTIAHRGYKTNFMKENTMDAFRNAINNGFDGIELDVRSCKDGTLVVLHDAYIKRTSDGSGLVKDMTYDQLKQYNFGSKETPSIIPTLESVFESFSHVYKIIELKSYVDLASVLKYVDEFTYFMSFDNSLIAKIKRKYPNLKCGILNFVLNSIKDYPYDMICLLDCVANDALVKKYLDKGVAVFIYGVVGKVNYVRDYDNLFYILDAKDASLFE